MLRAAVAAELLVARAADTACLVRHVAATRDGIAFLFVVHLREPMLAPDEDPIERSEENDPSLTGLTLEVRRLMWDDSRPTDDGGLRFWVELSDGRVFFPPGPSQAGGPGRLLGLGGSGDHERFQMEYWLPAFPPAGGWVEFVCAWAARTVAESRRRLDAAAIRAAAERARPMFLPSVIS